MPTRSAAEAIEAHRSAVASAVALVTQTPLLSAGSWRPGQPVVLALGDGGPVSLGGDVGLTLTASEHVVGLEFDGGWVPRTVAYLYAVGLGDDELLAFHWHPTGASGVRTPHLHVGAQVQIGKLWLPKAHIPTGIIALRDVLKLVLGQLGADPRRDDWRAILDAATDDRPSGPQQ